MTVGTAPAPLSGQSAGSPDYYNIPMTVWGGGGAVFPLLLNRLHPFRSS